MWNSGFHFGRRRRKPASIGLVALFLGLFLGWDYVQAEWQKREVYSGTIIRVYSEPSLMSRRTSHHYWEVRSPDGTLHTARIRSKNQWSAGHGGHQVVKRAGELIPTITG